MTQTTDNELIQQAQGGDFPALELLVSRHEGPLHAAAWHLTHNHHDSHDVVQNTFVSAMDILAKFGLKRCDEQRR